MAERLLAIEDDAMFIAFDSDADDCNKVLFIEDEANVKLLANDEDAIPISIANEEEA